MILVRSAEITAIGSWRRHREVPMTADSTPSLPTSTTFREWMDHLIASRGAQPEWPWLMREMLIAEFVRQKALGFCYASEVFKDRDADDPTTAVMPEKRAVKDLYHRCRIDCGGVFRIGTEAFWLLGYEWPNQGRDRGRRADLVGLNAVGGLVVFECKLATNSYGPFAAGMFPFQAFQISGFVQRTGQGTDGE